MSKIDALHKQLCRAANQTGSHQTREARQRTAQTFARWCKQQNLQLTGVKNRHLRDFIHHRQNVDGVSAGTLKNEAGHMRRMCPNLSFTNRELGIPERDRVGDKTPLSDNQYRGKLERIRDPGVRAAAQIQRELGLRNAETVRLGQNLNSAIRTVGHNGTVRISEGTKGGRLRISEVPNKLRALKALRDAKAIADQNGGQLVQGKNGDLKSAMNKYQNAMRRAGFTGTNSPHSNRYNYAQKLEQQYRDAGYSQQQARQLTAESLGHGDSRGRYVASVYGLK